MNSSFFVGDNLAEKSGGRWRQSLGRVLLPGALFAIAVFGAPSPNKDVVLSDSLALSEAGQLSLAQLNNAIFTGER